MVRNICIFADGTGQGGSIQRKDNSNVWRLYCATNKVDPQRGRQVCHYDTGLGAKSGGWTRWAFDKLSQATGLGISKNIKECYDFILKEYAPGDRIFLFGFSRGAYTVRSLGGVLKLCGVPTDWRGKTSEASQEAARGKLVEEAVETVYKHYGEGEKQRERVALGDKFRADHAAHEAAPFFIGVWDTVKALGVPGSSGLDFWKHAFHDSTLDRRVRYARHALAIDENREAFQPDIWEASAEDLETGRIKQHWFPGVHTDIGGGYEDDGMLAEISLRWIVDEATDGIEDPAERLLVDMTQIPTIQDTHPLALQHDQRHGLGRFWREGTRQNHHKEALWKGAVLADPSVLARLRADSVPYLGRPKGAYRPFALQGRFLPDWTLPPRP